MAKKSNRTLSVQDVLNQGKRKSQAGLPEQLRYRQHISNPVLSKELANQLLPKQASITNTARNSNKLSSLLPEKHSSQPQEIKKAVPTVVDINTGQNNDQTTTGRWIPRYD